MFNSGHLKCNAERNWISDLRLQKSYLLYYLYFKFMVSLTR